MDFTPQLPRNIDSAHSFFACLLLQKYGNDKKIINKNYQRLVIGDRTNRVCKEVIMSLFKNFGSKAKRTAAIGMLAALPLTFGAATANAEVQDARPFTETDAYAAVTSANLGSDVAVVHVGDLSPVSQVALDGMLLAMDRDHPDINVAVMNGATEQGVVLYVDGNGVIINDSVIRTEELRDQIISRVGGTQVASASVPSNTVAMN